jgi:cell wall-associated NlpC family hydrolase
MPFVGWVIFMVGASAAYAALKGEKLSDVLLHAMNASAFAAPIQTLKGSGSPAGNGSTNGDGTSTQTEAYTTNPTNGGAATAVGYAVAQLGKPYRWAGAGPNDFDCSGLTMQAYKAAGKVLPHHAQSQYILTSNRSLPIGNGNAYPPGSLVFFGSSKYTIDHVGIVTGPDQMIEAPHTGDVVKYYPISSESLPLVAVTNALGA